jgi:hypothetical protein
MLHCFQACTTRSTAAQANTPKGRKAEDAVWLVGMPGTCCPSAPNFCPGDCLAAQRTSLASCKAMRNLQVQDVHLLTCKLGIGWAEMPMPHHAFVHAMAWTQTVNGRQAEQRSPVHIASFTAKAAHCTRPEHVLMLRNLLLLHIDGTYTEINSCGCMLCTMHSRKHMQLLLPLVSFAV